MQQLIIGSLMLTVILLGGWLIYFYNKMTNQKIVVEEHRTWLSNHLQKRSQLLEAEQDQAGCRHQEEELAERIEVCRYMYKEAVIQYNNELAGFPGKAAKVLLGIKELSLPVNGEEEPRADIQSS